MEGPIFAGKTQRLEAFLQFHLQVAENIDGLDADPQDSRSLQIRKDSQPFHFQTEGHRLSTRFLQDLLDRCYLLLDDISQELKGQMNRLGFGKPAIQIEFLETIADLTATPQDGLRNSNRDEGTDHGQFTFTLKRAAHRSGRYTTARSFRLNQSRAYREARIRIASREPGNRSCRTWTS